MSVASDLTREATGIAPLLCASAASLFRCLSAPPGRSGGAARVAVVESRVMLNRRIVPDRYTDLRNSLSSPCVSSR